MQSRTLWPPANAERVTLLRLTLLGTALLCASCGAVRVADDVSTPTVIEIVDGDTIVVALPGHDPEPVRLLGVDTPETSDPARPVQCFGAEATNFLRELIPPGTAVRLERDIEARDRYGRLLAYVFRADDGLFVNAELLRLGFADLSVYDPNNAYVAQLRNELLTAQTGARGLWSACGGPDVPLDPT